MGAAGSGHVDRSTLGEQTVGSLLANAGRRTAPGKGMWVGTIREPNGAVFVVGDTVEDVGENARAAQRPRVAPAPAPSRNDPGALDATDPAAPSVGDAAPAGGYRALEGPVAIGGGAIAI